LYRSDSSLYVPCDNPELTGKMLPPLTPDQIRETVAQVKEMPASWVRDFRQRSEASKKALSSGDRVEVLFLMKNIHCHKKDAAGEGKRIHTTDDYFLKDAENLICHEFAFVLNQEVSAVLSELKKELELN